jgi:hypothetical protein
MEKKLDNLYQKNADFFTRYVYDVLGADPQGPPDSTVAYVNRAVNILKPVFEASEKKFRDFTAYRQELTQALQFVKYYFPNYILPTKVVTFIGSPDGTANIYIQHDALYIGLQQHLGKDAIFYKDELTRGTYPEYKSRRFEPEYIAINSIQNISYDLYPDQSEGKSLVYQMIESGKRLYLMSKCLPYKKEHMLIGYTEQQMKDSKKNEDEIWDYFTQNGLLHNNDKIIIRNYIGDSPRTQDLGEECPGDIGSFIGWQIVKKYKEKYPEVSLSKLLQTNSEVILERAKYKP